MPAPLRSAPSSTLTRASDLSPLVDPAAVAAEITLIAARHARDVPKMRSEVVALLKETILLGRTAAERLLIEDGRGARCARRLSLLQDVVIRAVYDFAANTIYPATNPSTAEQMAVVAVGGYGRGTLAPGSDIDLLFLLPYKQTPWGESVVEYMLYMLWDLGFKVGHATRSVNECIRLARSDMTIRTAVLEARFLWGKQSLYDELVARFDKEVAKGTGPDFIAAKLGERDERHRRQGESRYLVEPNVKEGKGGLRDLHTLFWIAKYFYRVNSSEELVELGVFSRTELTLFNKCEDFLWAVRCHMHFVTGRPEERLGFELQRDLAERLGYQQRPGLEPVERFMKHYFLVAKDVGDLTLIFCASLEVHHGKPVPMLNRFLGLARRRRRQIAGTKDFFVDHERINVIGDDVFARDPVNLIRLFHFADRHELAFHPDAMKLVRRSLGLIDNALRDNAEANGLFIEILTSRRQPELVLRRMNEAGVLGRFIPDFGKIVSMMQFNMYHHYTVDEHLLRAIGILAEIEHGDLKDEHPLANEIFPGLADRIVLYVALFLHDVAKGRPEDHSIAGAHVAEKLCPRLGLDAQQTETVAWLVEQHLTMSKIAQGRDLNDRKTILDFAAIVQTPERLKLLLILTVCDIKAVGPGVWNGWKGQLLRTLYWEAETVLTGGHSQGTRDRRVADAKKELAEALTDWSETERTAYLDRHYPAYWLRVDLPHKIEHARLIREADAAGRSLATATKLLSFEAVTEVTVFAPDHPRLLSIIAGACTVAGANIVGAQIFTTTDGRALDAISIGREFADDIDEERRAGKVSQLIEKALSGEVQLPEVIADKSKPRSRTKAFYLEPRILIDNSWSNQFTAIEASGLDRPGLLYDLTRSLSDLNLNIGSAHVATFGERAVDVFYVTDLVGHKITSSSREAATARQLKAVFEGGATDSNPARRGAA